MDEPKLEWLWTNGLLAKAYKKILVLLVAAGNKVVSGPKHF